MADFGEDVWENEYDGEDGDYEEDYITAEDCWTVISSFFARKGLVSQQIDSFDEFTNSTVQSLIDEYSTVSLDQTLPESDEPDPARIRRYEIKFGKILMTRPTLTEADGSIKSLLPYECRDRNLTYSCPLYVKVTKTVSVAREKQVPYEDMDSDQQQHYTETGELPTTIMWDEEMSDEDHASKANKPEHLRDMIYIGKLPVMVKSSICHLRGEDDDGLFMLNECPYDQGGYFIINGSEKVLIAQERSAANIVQVFKKAQPSPDLYQAEIRSALEKGSRLISSTTLKLKAKGETARGGFGQTIQVTIPYIKKEVPIAIVFRALGVISDEDILNSVCYDRNDNQMMEMLRPCIEEAFAIQEREIALDYIAKRGNQGHTISKIQRMKNAKDILQKELLPHIAQTEGCETRKAYFLGYMTHKLLQCALGRRDTDDRDHFGKKRLDLAGPLLAKLFRNIVKKLTGDMMAYMKRCVSEGKHFDLALGIRHSTLTNGLKYSLATGNWGEQKKAMSSTAGVSQVLNRYTFSSTLSHLRRTNTPIGRDGKLAKPRQLHNTHWGLVCPAETPEGQACGLVKNLSLMCYVSVGSPAEPIKDFMVQRNMEVLEEYEPGTSPDSTKIFINGTWVGVHNEPAHLVSLVQDLRRKCIISHEVSLVRDIRDREFKIFSDAGRVMRPLFVVNPEDNPETGAQQGALALTKEHIRRLEEDAQYNRKKEDEDYFGWDGLQNSGCIEYLDAEEEETAMICMSPEDLDEYRRRKARGKDAPEEEPEEENRSLNARVKTKINPDIHMYTHCEIHPSMLLGICASIIPFPDHNQVRSSFITLRSHLLTKHSHLVILTSRLWVSKQWVSSLPTTPVAWIRWRISSTIPKSHLQRHGPWNS